jgi:hypothetical protein
MKNPELSQFEGYVLARNWEPAVDALNSLAMFEMLPPLARLSPALRTEVLKQALQILSLQRGWQGSYDRIRFASETVTTRSIPKWTSSWLPVDQVDDAKRFLGEKVLSVSVNPVTRVIFGNADKDHLIVTVPAIKSYRQTYFSIRRFKP